MKDFTKYDFKSYAIRLNPMRSKIFSDSPIRLVGIRGANDAPGQQNSFAHYDDALIVFIDGEPTAQFLASTDPAWALVVHPIVDGGAAQLCPGIHLFEKHFMHGKYPCLGQAESCHINRLKPDGTVDHMDYGDFGICIHSGGDGMDTRRFSAGCQIIQNPDGYFQQPAWGKFWNPIRDEMGVRSLETAPYFLVNASDLT